MVIEVVCIMQLEPWMTEYAEKEVPIVKANLCPVQELAFKIGTPTLAIRLYILCLLRLRILSLLDTQARLGIPLQGDYTLGYEEDAPTRRSRKIPDKCLVLPFGPIVKRTDESIAVEARSLLLSGLSERRVSSLIGVPRTTMRRILKRLHC